ncbi:hypothetical protein GUJ93_ZPchr0006g44857 [Zizania palustris]|uniref:Uncharacterized protein n=1 Tax=Zizania palustris TaxID=103762 RepID=A0A8J5SKT8_ZIZPA|nr:hypothetical protein GUJ93_ZPchr0006g44857 [Zizania palustris]
MTMSFIRHRWNYIKIQRSNTHRGGRRGRSAGRPKGEWEVAADHRRCTASPESPWICDASSPRCTASSPPVRTWHTCVAPMSPPKRRRLGV